MRYIAVILLMTFIGCTFSRQMEVRAIAINIESVYGEGNGDVMYKSNTTTGFLNGKR